MISRWLFLSQVTGNRQHADRRRPTVQKGFRCSLQRRACREDIVQKEQPTPRRTGPAREGVTDVAPSFLLVHPGLLPRAARSPQAGDFRQSKPPAQQTGQHVRLVVAACQAAEPMQRHRHDSVQRFVPAVCPPGNREAFRQKRRQMKASAVFELMNPMPRLPFKGKRGHRKLPWPVVVLQLALPAFVQQAVRWPSATRASTLRQCRAFVQAVRAHLLFSRQQRPAAART